MRARRMAAPLALALLAGAIGWGFHARRHAADEGDGMTPQLAAALDAVRRARICFYHHSVGADVLAGIEALEDRRGGERVRMVPVEEAARSGDGPALVHGGGGRNGDPRSKIDAFAARVRDPAFHADLAFMKLCYVDFEPRTDVDALFAYYEQTILALRRERPDVRLAHVTVPLMQRPDDVRSRLRRVLGREVWTDAANARRSEFSARLAARFAADPILDLARVESTAPDGTRVEYVIDGWPVPSLFPGYTEDGGHLNALGRRVAAEETIRFLAAALGARGAADAGRPDRASASR